MPTISDLINQATERRKAAERRQSDATRAAKSVMNAVNADGRTQLTESESLAVDQAMEAQRRAKDEIKECDGEIKGLRAQAAQEAEVDRKLRETVPTGVHAGVGNTVHMFGSGTRTAEDGPQWVRTADRRPAAVGRSQRFVDQELVADQVNRTAERDRHVVGQHGSLGQLVRAMTTTSGSAIVPTVWLGDIIDRARNLSAVLRAGADIVPMDAKVVQIGRLTGDPTAAFRTEGSTITATDPTFDNVTLTATTMSALVIGSLEWFQDASNADEVVANAIAQAMATQLDLVALFGGLTTGNEGFSLAQPPNPRGVLATLLAVAASSVLGGVANGTAQTATTFWNEVIDAIYFPRTFNEEPNAMLWNAKLAQQYAKAYDSTGQPLAMPGAVAELSKFVTNQIPSFTSGTMTSRATDLFVGDWSQLLIGQRLDFAVQTLTERYAETGQVGIVAHWRGDVQLARPRAFSVYRYLQGA